MKKKFLLLIVMLLSFASVVNAKDLSCTYKLIWNYNGGYATDSCTSCYTDTVTFYIKSGKLDTSKFTIGSSGDQTKWPGNITASYSIFNGKMTLYMASPAYFGYDLDGITSCPLTLDNINLLQVNGETNAVGLDSTTYYSLGTNSGTLGRGSVTFKVDSTTTTTTKKRVTNEANNICHIYPDVTSCNEAEQGCIWSFTDNACYQKSSSSATTTKTTTTTAASSSRVNCGDEYVVSKYNGGTASDSEFTSVNLQYYMENGKKHVQVQTVCGGKVLTTVSKSLDGVTSYLEINDFKDETGKGFRISSFDDCNNVKMQVCECDDNVVLAGETCEEDWNCDSSTSKTPETYDEYVENYNENFNESSSDLPTTYRGGCPLGDDVTKDLSGALKVLRILAPILCIVFTTMDVIKTLTKGEIQAEAKKIAIRFGKRLAVTLVLLFLTVIVDAFMQLFDVWDSDGTCDYESITATSIGNLISDKSLKTNITEFYANIHSMDETKWEYTSKVKGLDCYYSISSNGDSILDYVDLNGADSCNISNMSYDCTLDEVTNIKKCSLYLTN